MSSTSLADRIRANRKSRSPVSDTVHELFDEISEAVASGSSFRNIHAQLSREGHKVGRGHSSLYAAFIAVKARRERSPSSLAVPHEAPSGPVVGRPAVISVAAPSGQMPPAIIDTRRKTTDW